MKVDPSHFRSDPRGIRIWMTCDRVTVIAMSQAAMPKGDVPARRI